MYEWDERKSEENLQLRGFDFAQACKVFLGKTFEREDLRRAYGERRMISVGKIHDVYVVVVFTDRVEGGVRVRRIISARHASRRERRFYEEETNR